MIGARQITAYRARGSWSAVGDWGADAEVERIHLCAAFAPGLRLSQLEGAGADVQQATAQLATDLDQPELRVAETGSDVQGDRLQIDGRWYLVVGVEPPSSGGARHRAYRLAEIPRSLEQLEGVLPEGPR